MMVKVVLEWFNMQTMWCVRLDGMKYFRKTWITENYSACSKNACVCHWTENYQLKSICCIEKNTTAQRVFLLALLFVEHNFLIFCKILFSDWYGVGGLNLFDCLVPNLIEKHKWYYTRNGILTTSNIKAIHNQRPNGKWSIKWIYIKRILISKSQTLECRQQAYLTENKRKGLFDLIWLTRLDKHNNRIRK